jgi:hypothetical protein
MVVWSVNADYRRDLNFLSRSGYRESAHSLQTDTSPADSGFCDG